MSEIMHGVLNMPPEIWPGDPVDVVQRHAVYVEASKLILAQEAEIKRLKDEIKRLKEVE